MPTLTVKNLPDGLYRQLKERAATQRRSINSEILIGLERHLGSARFDPDAFLARLDAIHKRMKTPRVTKRFIQQAKLRGRA